MGGWLAGGGARIENIAQTQLSLSLTIAKIFILHFFLDKMKLAFSEERNLVSLSVGGSILLSISALDSLEKIDRQLQLSVCFS